jgi:hypothetical protein
VPQLNSNHLAAMATWRVPIRTKSRSKHIILTWIYSDFGLCPSSIILRGVFLTTTDDKQVKKTIIPSVKNTIITTLYNILTQFLVLKSKHGMEYIFQYMPFL